MRVDIYSDVACPWCYIGLTRIREAAEVFRSGTNQPVDLTWHPFQLDPAAPVPGVPERVALAAKLGPNASAALGRVTEVAASAGLTFDLDRSVIGNTFDAHRVLWLAATRGVQEAVAERLFRARFSEGLDVSDPDVLAKVSDEAGLPAAAVAELLSGDGGVAEVGAEIEAARELGVSAVPLFVFEGQWGVSGAQSSELLVDAMREIAARTAPEGAASAPE